MTSPTTPVPDRPTPPADEPFALTPLQQAYWVGRTDGIELGGIDAHEYFAVDCVGLDLDRALLALRRLVTRHDVLRVAVTADGRQSVHHTAEPRVTVQDLRGLPEARVRQATRAVADRLTGTGPDPTRPPLLDVVVQRLDAGRDRVHVSIGFLIADGHTQHALVEDWMALYRDPQHPPEPPAGRYRQVLAGLFGDGAGTSADRAYWQDRLKSLAPAPELPVADRSAPPGARFTRRTARLAPDDWRALQRHAAAAGVGREAALLAAYAEVLAHWSKAPVFTLLVLSSRRSADPAAGRQVLGNLGGTVCVQIDCRHPVSFAERARAVERQLRADLAHASADGVWIARQTARAQGWSARVVFPVVFAGLLEVDTSFLADFPVPAELVDSALQTPQVRLDHQVYEYGGGLVANWDTVDAVFRPGFTEAAFAAYQRLVAGLAEERGWRQPVATSGLLPRSARVEPVTDALTLDASGLLHTPFFTAAADTPERLAVVDGPRRITYGELAGRAEAVASWLVDHGAGPGMLLPVVTDKGAEQVIAVLGVLRAGAAYLPIDAALPAARIRFLLDRCAPGVGLTQSWVADRCALPGERAWLHLDEAPVATGGPVTGPRCRPDDTAYVIYTSGSTGEPKGVQVAHRSAVNTVADVSRVIALDSDDVLFGLSLLSFDLSVFDVFGALSAGATLVLPDRARLREPGYWSELVATEKITVWNSVPALLEILVDHVESNAGSAPPTSVRATLLSGDWIPVTLPDRVRRLWPGAEVIGMGGATEGSIWSIMYPVGAVDPAWRSIPYGRAMTHQRMYVLDGHGQPRPEWAIGEIAIGGVGVAVGYWQDPERTADRFVRHEPSGARLYRTGDLGRVHPDGTIELLGRNDSQVKVNGYRVELGEIESALLRLDGIRDAVAVVRSAGTSGRALAAYVVAADENRPPDCDELRERLAATLPAYMVPSLLRRIDEVPLTPNGKVDRARLASLLPAHDAAGDPTHRAPADAVETDLTAIFADLLGVPELGVTEDFFAVGGNSFLAIRLLTAIGRRFGVEIPVTELFAAPTVAAVAERIRRHADASDGTRERTDGGPAADAAGPATLVGAPLLTLRTSATTAEPVFWVHPVGGAASCYRDLAHALPVDRPMYGLESVGLRSDETPHGSVEEMAADYLARIRAVAPAGPYLLAGWSMGGLIALEMARRLHAAGEPVGRLVVVDAVLPAADAAPVDLTDATVLARMVADLTGEARPTTATVPDRAAAFDRVRARGVLPAETPESTWRRLCRVYEANLRALERYRPGDCPVPVTLVQAADRPDGTPPPAASWQRPGVGCTVTTVPGDHYSMWLPPRLPELTAALAHPLG